MPEYTYAEGTLISVLNQRIAEIEARNAALEAECDVLAEAVVTLRKKCIAVAEFWCNECFVEGAEEQDEAWIMADFIRQELELVGRSK